MAINSETKRIISRILDSHINSCNDYINLSEAYLLREKGKADPEYIFSREKELEKSKERLRELKSAIKDVQLNA